VKKFLNMTAIALLVGVLASCASSGSVSTREAQAEVAVYDRAFWDRSPKGSQLIFIGVGAFRSNHDEAIKLAVENAARQVAIFHRVEGSFMLQAVIGSGTLDYRADTETSLRFDDAYVKYVDSLEYDVETDVRERDNSIFVRTRYTAPVAIAVAFTPSADEARPAWVKDPPSELGAYTAAVGQAGRRSQHRDTVNASHENAILSIIRNRSSSSKSETKSTETDTNSTGETKSRLEASGVVERFYILETWTDPADKAVWTLGIVPKD
jgi:hypothetical protein